MELEKRYSKAKAAGRKTSRRRNRKGPEDLRRSRRGGGDAGSLDEPWQRRQESVTPWCSGTGRRLTHQDERGLVHLNLRDQERRGRRRKRSWRGRGRSGSGGFPGSAMMTGRGNSWPAVLRPQFGRWSVRPGGIFTEALGDVVFRVRRSARSGRGHAGGITIRNLLGPFRGEASADRRGLIATITGLSRLGLTATDITE
jgi:hypothetical protein